MSEESGYFAAGSEVSPQATTVCGPEKEPAASNPLPPQYPGDFAGKVDDEVVNPPPGKS
jgi:hypothetical protein